MTVSTALALLGLACYSVLFVAVAASPMHAKGRVRRLFMASLVTMTAWQLSALAVSLASSEGLAMVAYQAMAIIVVAFSVLYTLFIRAFLVMPPSPWFSATGGVLSLAIVVSVVWARAGIYRDLVWDGTAQFYLPTYGPLSLIIGVPYYALLGYVAHLIQQAYRDAQEPLRRSRLQYLLLGWCVVLVGTMANFVPQLRSYPIDLMANVVNAGLIAYAIFRYRLLDISFVVRKGLAYSIPTAVIAIVYFLTVYVVEQLLRAFAGYQVMLISLAVAAITAIVAQPLRDRAQLWVDRAFFREQYDAHRMLQDLSEAATSILDVGELASVLETRLCETMHIRHVCVLVRDSSSGCYRLARSASRDLGPSVLRLRGDHPVVRWLADHRVPLTRAQTRQVSMPGSGLSDDWGALDEVAAQLALPLVVRETLVGVLIVGPKLSEAPYTQDELRTLSTLANQIAIATENARLYGEAQSEIADRRNAEAALRESQGRYRSLFEASPIALWEEDLSAVRVYLRQLRGAGVGDLAAHLRAHPEAVAHCASLARVVSANRATLSMYGAESVESFADGLGMVVGEGFPTVFVEGLLALEAGEMAFSSEAVQRTLAGDRRHVVLRWSVVPGHEETAGMVLVSTQDVTERREREQMLRRRTARLELLRAIDEAILESHPVDQTIEMTLRSTRRLLECGGAGLVTLALADDRVSLIALDAGDGLDPAVGDQLVPAELSGRESETLRHLRQGSVEVVDDLDGVPYPTPVIRRLREMGYRSALLAPALHRQPLLVDTLVVLSKEPGAFGEDAKETALEVAHSLALAVRSNEMRREILERTKALERQLSRVNLFNEITRAIAARRDLHSILGAVAQRLEEGFAESADVWMSRSASSAGEPPDGKAGETGAVAYPDALLTDFPELVDVRPGGAVYLADLCAHDVPSARALVRERGMKSAVVIPLTVDGDVLGGLACARRDPDAFSRAERDFLGGLGEHVAIAVHQAQLHKQLEQAYNDLRETQRSAMRQERLRALGEMASGIAHDISNAISPVALYAGLIETREDLGEQSQAYLRTIRLAVRDVEETVGRMRQFYRTREDEDLQPVDVNLAIRQALELTRPRWRDVPQERGVTVDLVTDLKPDLPVVGGNAGEIRQTLTNLILNAVDAMPEGGTLSLSTRSGVGAGACVIVEVVDTGIGMEEETQARAFEPFFSTKGARGSGLGLATVYGTMQRHGGDVQVESTWGQGTTMRLLFPCHTLTDEPVREKPAPRSAPLRILCVDDEPLVRDALEIVLLQEGHAVEMAAGGEAALAAVEEAAKRGDPFDVVLTDLGMPRVDGRAVARGVKQMSPRTPVILLTGWGQRMLAEHDLPDHVDLLLSKPPTIEALTQALAQVASHT